MTVKPVKHKIARGCPERALEAFLCGRVRLTAAEAARRARGGVKGYPMAIEDRGAEGKRGSRAHPPAWAVGGRAHVGTPAGHAERAPSGSAHAPAPPPVAGRAHPRRWPRFARRLLPLPALLRVGRSGSAPGAPGWISAGSQAKRVCVCCTAAPGCGPAHLSPRGGLACWGFVQLAPSRPGPPTGKTKQRAGPPGAQTQLLGPFGAKDQALANSFSNY